MIKHVFSFFLVLLMTELGSSSRFTRENAEMISEGITSAGQKLRASTVTCEPTYGFLPCTTELWGLIFQIVVYQYFLSYGQKYVSAGSDLFLKTFGPDVIGAFLFHFLGTIPQVTLIIMSRLSGSTTHAQQQAGIGMSLLAGSAVMLLTLIWGTSVAIGSYDLSDPPTSSEVKPKRPLSLTGFGVITDVDTTYTARIMSISVIPLLILQLTKVVGSSSGERVIVLISLIVTLVLLLSYVLYQVFQPWIQNRRFEYLSQKLVKDKLLRLLSFKGKPNKPLIREIFHEIDKNNDSYISTSELRVLILGIQIEDDGFIRDDYAEKLSEMFDISGDKHIDEEEFVKVLSNWLVEAEQSGKHQYCRTRQNDSEEGQTLLVKRKRHPIVGEDAWKNYTEAAFLLLIGTTITVLLARPLIETVVEVATVSNIPQFFIPYVVIPFTLNIHTALSTITSARQKTENSISLTLSQIYGSVFMSNMIGLTSFLIVVYIRDLSSDFSAENLVVLIICTVMGGFTSFRTKFPLWSSYLAILLYPISLFVLYVLTTVYGWS